MASVSSPEAGGATGRQYLLKNSYLLYIYETALIYECGYNGAQPFWDWTLDDPENNGAQFNNSPIFDPVYGFGGNGENGSVTPGPFPDGNYAYVMLLKDGI
jgi:tyrosinase